MSRKTIPHIMVDAFPLVDTHFSGVGHYTLGVVRGFDELAAESKLTYSLIVPRGWADRIDKYQLEHCTTIIKNPVPNKIIRGFMKYHWRVPFDLILGRGCYYFPSFLNWPLLRSRSSVVVHDVTYLAVPECVDKGNREYLERVVPFSIKNSTNIVSVSQFSKDEIVRYYKLDPNNIFVAHPSVDRTHFYKRSAAEIHAVKARYDIFSEKYILSVGNIEPRKNYGRLIDAYTALPKAITDKYPLVIVGAGGWNNQAEKAKMQAAKEAGYKIINPKQFVLDEDMPALYSGAQFLAFTPIYEGFGMPPLEAYACGTPVLASKVASVPEAAGDAAVYVDPFSTEDITEKLQTMVERTEADRDQFMPAIKAHLKSLAWRPTAEITAAALTGKPVEYFRSGGES